MYVYLQCGLPVDKLYNNWSFNSQLLNIYTSLFGVIFPVCSQTIPNYVFFSSGLQPASNLQTFNVDKRRVSYTFTASPIYGATYKVTFTPQRAGIPQPQMEVFTSAGFRTTSGLTPDVTYRLQVVAVLNGDESAAISVNFTTVPDGKTIVAAMYIFRSTYNR